MKIQVRARQLQLGDEVRAHVERRLAFSLDRFRARVRRVTVHLVDVNGPRGGEDKACRIEARLRPTGAVFAEGFGTDLLSAVDGAAARIVVTLARALKRDRSFARPKVAKALPAASSSPAEGSAERSSAERDEALLDGGRRTAP
jgi:ribosome-associated translation inhibitor RaiA